jgi:hydrogenase maturation protease
MSNVEGKTLRNSAVRYSAVLRFVVPANRSFIQGDRMQEINTEEQALSKKNLRELPDLWALAGFCHPPLSRRTAVIGVGNRLWGDDGAGPELLKRLMEEWAVRETSSTFQGQYFFIDAGEFPEDWLIRVADLEPDVILLIDAMELHAEPGSMAVLEPEALPEAVCYSTHRLPLRTLLRLWEERGSKAFVLGIQPKDVIFKEGLSPEVKMSVDSLAQFFSQSFCTE